MPPWVTGRRSSVRRTVTSVVSRIGIASTSSGSTRLVSVAPAVVQLDASASEARPKPSTWLPESPMKTRALRPGRRLKGRKPRQAPPSASATTSASSPESCASAASAKTAQETAASDAASPSMLSSRLNAFVIPTSQTSPSTVASTSLPKISTVSPEARTTPAAANWAISFAIGFSV